MRHTLSMIQTRLATARDAAGICVLLCQLGYPTTEAEAKARLEYWSADQHSAVIAADLDGDLAGVAAVHAIPLLEHAGWRGRLVALVVAEARRGCRLGRALVTAAEAAAELLGCREMEITSARDRAAAHSLYASAGYADVCNRAARYLKPLAPSG